MVLYPQEFPEATEVVSEEKMVSIYNLIVEGGLGGQIIITILLVLFTFSIYIYIERLLAIRAALKIDKNFMDQIKDSISNGKFDAANALCRKINSPIARLIEKGITRIGKPLDDISKAIENVGKLEVYQLEKNVSIVATIAGAAPMIGFLGTVIGMIVAIHEIANAGGQIDIKLLSDGLYTAMTTTVAGLIVGIVAYITYHHIVVKIDTLRYQMEAKTVEFLDLLNEPIA